MNAPSRSGHRNTRRRDSRRRQAWLPLLLALSFHAHVAVLHAQDTEGDNPTGPAGSYGGEVTTAGSYDPYTQNIKRSVTDLVVPASNGTYPLAFTRTYNSQSSSNDTSPFGDGGNWRHSYMWTVNAITPPNSGVGVAFLVSYPDGATVTFRANRSGLVSDPYWRGPSGTSDRLEMDGYSAKCLHLSDGGLVTFTGAFASTITDPYGAVTKLTYFNVPVQVNGISSQRTYLSQVTEPGGRRLNFFYKTVTYHGNYVNGGQTNSYTWVVLDYIQASTGQTVTYHYVTDDPGGQLHDEGDGGSHPAWTSPYYVLDSVSYDAEQSTSGTGSVRANYTYNPSTGAPPLLSTAHDPHYAGAMVDIRYAANGVQEQNYGTGQCVSRLDRDPQAPLASSFVETRGDKAADGSNITRNFVFNEGQNVSGDYYWNSYLQRFYPTNGSEQTDAKNAQVTSYTDFEPQKNRTTLSYYPPGDPNGMGNLRAVTDALQHTTGYLHEPVTGKVTGVSLPDGRFRQSVWRSKDLSETTFPSLQPYYLRQTIDERGQTTTYDRFPNTGLVKQVNYPDGSNEQFVYSAFAQGSAGYYYKIGYKKTKLGAQIYYGYGSNPSNPNGTAADLLTSVTRYYNDGTGSLRSETTTFTYDSLDRPYQTTDPRGVATRFTYNARHQLTSTIHVADGTHVDRYYDDLGNLTYLTDELGDASSFGYDAYRRPTLVVQDVLDGTNDHHVDYYSYDPRDTSHNSYSSATSHTRSSWSVHQQQGSRAAWHVYSPNNWLTDTYAGTLHGHTVYNPVGLAQSTNDDVGPLDSYTYDVCNRLYTATDPNGHVSTTNYYGAGETAASGNNVNCAGLLKNTSVPGADASYSLLAYTQYANYDLMGRLLQTVAPTNNGSVPSLTFDSLFDLAGNLTSQDDGAEASGQHQTGYGYDALGRKVSCSYPDGTAEHWTYDASGNVATYVTRGSQTQTFTYDGRNRCTYASWSNNAAWATGYEYDAASRRTRVYNAYADNHFTYDDSGGLLSESAQVLNMPVETTSYTHDIDGRVTGIVYPHGDNPHYSYDATGRCTDVSFGNTTYAHYNYDARGQLASRCLSGIGVDTAYSYQNNGRVSYLWHYKGDSSGNHTANGSIRLQFYGYAPDGQVSWTYRAGGGDQSGRNSALDDGQGDAYYYYADGSLSTAYRNDGVQNNGWPAQQSATQDARVDPGSLVNWGGSAPSIYDSFVYDKAGNRTSASISSVAVSYPAADGENRYPGMSYDGNGNATNTQQGWAYGCNAANQLIAATGPNGQALYFGYDGLGRLVADNVNGVPKVYYYAGSQRIEEYNNGTQTALCQYFFDGPGSDSIFLRVDPARGYLWSLYDALGNTTHLCDTNGNVLEQYLYDASGTPTVYDAYGNVRAGGTAWDNRYLFKGAAAYEWYAQASLYYCRTRFYEPHHGRWLQPDPIGQAGGLNIYAYCGNDPINRADPSGHSDAPGSSLVPGEESIDKVIITPDDGGEGMRWIQSIQSKGLIGGDLRINSYGGRSLLGVRGLYDGSGVSSLLYGPVHDPGPVAYDPNEGSYDKAIMKIAQLAMMLLGAFAGPEEGMFGEMAMGATAQEVTDVVVITAEGSEMAAEGGGTIPSTLYHYTGEAKAASIAENGLTPGASGQVFTTTNGGLTPVQAQIELALSPNRGLPGAMFEIDAAGLREAGITPSLGPLRVQPTMTAPGGGTEVIFNQQIPAEFLKRGW